MQHFVEYISLFSLEGFVSRKSRTFHSVESFSEITSHLDLVMTSAETNHESGETGENR